MKRFTNHPEPWGEFIDVKYWPEINKPGKYVGKEAFFCSVTDPYQPLEKKYGRTRALLEQLLPTGISISISSKSDLILRDLDLIKQFPSAHVAWSINTLDEDFRNWIALDQEIRAYTEKEGMMYIRDDDQHRSPFGEPPVVCNYFYHEEVRKSAKREK